MKAYYLALLAFVAAASPVRKPEWPYGDYNTCQAELKKMPASRDADQLRTCFSLKNNVERFALIAGGRATYAKFIQAIENARLDKQDGSPAGADGSTSIVSKGAVPQALAVAVENGAISRSQEGTTMTYRGNVGGMARLVTGGEVFPYCTVVENRCPALTRIFDAVSASVSFDPSRTTPEGTGSQSAPPLIFTGQGRQVANWTVRADWHTRPSGGYRDQWLQAMANTQMHAAASDALKALGTKLDTVRQTPEYQTWENQLVNDLRTDAATTEPQAREIALNAATRLVPIVKAYVDRLPTGVNGGETFDAYIRSVVQSYGTYLGTRDKVLDLAINRFSFALEFSQTRPVSQPALSTIRLIFSDRPGNSDKALLTVNTAVEFYNKLPAGAGEGRFRDGQAAVQFDRTVGTLASLNTAISAGYYWQYMKDDALLKIPPGSTVPNTAIELPGDAAKLLGTKGSIHVAQGKLTFTLKNTGIKLPIAITVSNRTELIKGNRIGANIGLLFDLDTILAKR